MVPENPAAVAEGAAQESIFYEASPKPFTLGQRMKIVIIAWLGYWLIRLIGSTLRWEAVGQKNWDAIFSSGRRAIYTFWHRCIFSATWFWRKRGIVVMTSQNFDGEYIARIIRAHGYGAARGSSSRGGLRALAEMDHYLRRGGDVAFTIDGPRGPRFIAKQGPVILARRSGQAIFCFHIALERAYTFRKSWDLFQIPLPFNRAVIFMAPAIYVPADPDEETLRAKQSEMQAILDCMREMGERWFAARPAEQASLRARIEA
jgi:lysophospholipid acyltransferase (LPLAT)-like uncharacterized protein